MRSSSLLRPLFVVPRSARPIRWRGARVSRGRDFAGGEADELDARLADVDVPLSDAQQDLGTS